LLFSAASDLDEDFPLSKEVQDEHHSLTLTDNRVIWLLFNNFLKLTCCSFSCQV